jgi:hypothetical protein
LDQLFSITTIGGRYEILIVFIFLTFSLSAYAPAAYDDSECGEILGGFEGFVSNSLISQEKIGYVIANKLQLDCMWVIHVQEGWKVCPLKLTTLRALKSN